MGAYDHVDMEEIRNRVIADRDQRIEKLLTEQKAYEQRVADYPQKLATAVAKYLQQYKVFQNEILCIAEGNEPEEKARKYANIFPPEFTLPDLPESPRPYRFDLDIRGTKGTVFDKILKEIETIETAIKEKETIQEQSS